MLTDRRLRDTVIKSFRRRGLTLGDGAYAELRDQLSGLEAQDVREALAALIPLLTSHSSVVTGKAVRGAWEVLEPAEASESTASSGFLLLNTQDQVVARRLTYHDVRKQFCSTGGETTAPMFSEASHLTTLFLERYRVIQQRVLRMALFSEDAAAPGDAHHVYKITPIAMLSSLALGSGPALFCVLGLLVKRKGDLHVLEDPSGCIPVDLSGTQCAPGLFVPGTLALVEGIVRMTDGQAAFEALTLGFPPAESRTETLSVFPSLLPEYVAQSKAISGHVPLLGVFSQLHMDRQDPIVALRQALSGLQDNLDQDPGLEYVLVFAGNYSSRSYPSVSLTEYLGCIKQLGSIIASYTTLVQRCSLVFMPGDTDPGVLNILPQPPMLDMVQAALLEKLPQSSVSFASNPARLYIDEKEIVVFRRDLLALMENCCVVAPTPQDQEDSSTSELLVKTLIDQSHLLPVSPMLQPVSWALDYSLRLYPAPDALVLCDNSATTSHFEWNYLDTLCYNPGNFSAEETFAVLDVSAPRKEAVEFLHVA